MENGESSLGESERGEGARRTNFERERFGPPIYSRLIRASLCTHFGRVRGTRACGVTSLSLSLSGASPAIRSSRDRKATPECKEISIDFFRRGRASGRRATRDVGDVDDDSQRQGLFESSDRSLEPDVPLGPRTLEPLVLREF